VKKKKKAHPYLPCSCHEENADLREEVAGLKLDLHAAESWSVCHDKHMAEIKELKKEVQKWKVNYERLAIKMDHILDSKAGDRYGDNPNR
jgi:hypothetical protein